MSDTPTLYWHLPEFPPDQGGIGTYAATLLPLLHDMGISVTGVVAQGGPSRQEHGGVELIREPLWASFIEGNPRSILRAKRRVAELRREIAADAYHVHLCEPSAVLMLQTADVNPGPLVVTLHSDGMPHLVGAEPDGTVARLLAAADVCTAVSIGVAEEVLEAAPHVASRLVTIPNGIVPDDPSPLPDEPRLLAIGRLMEAKGFERLIRAMPHVVDRVPEVHLDVLGQGVLRDSLEALAAELGVGGHVTFHGQVDRSEVRAAIARSRLVVAPSLREGLPYALLETASGGRAIVGSRVSGISDAVVDGESGVLVDQEDLDRDPTILGGIIADLLGDTERLERMSAAALRHVVTEFSAERCAAAYAQLYRSLVAPTVDVAVVIPAFDSARHIGDSVGSALAAIDHAGCSGTLIVVDDGSSDDTGDVARSIDDERVQVFRQPNMGQGLARNTGLALTRSDFVAHLDADDVWPVDRLTRLLDAIRDDDELDAVFGSAVEFADHDAPATARWSPQPQPARMPTTGLIRRSAHDTYGGFPAVRSADQIGWVTQAIAQGLRYRQIDHVTLRRRIHATNNSHRHPFTEERSRIAVLREMRKRQRAAAEAAGSADSGDTSDPTG